MRYKDGSTVTFETLMTEIKTSLESNDYRETYDVDDGWTSKTYITRKGNVILDFERKCYGARTEGLICNMNFAILCNHSHHGADITNLNDLWWNDLYLTDEDG